ncbi:MAG: hypothetical protein NC338_03970 [Firmicutes bacterium]|nr:hypothetical protein [Bacillota bacterium]MCM1401006.1 hypothetical protein [Bacteroides sp.]MCM1476533.1 hypothetical protein [Bacteroides sp.]
MRAPELDIKLIRLDEDKERIHFHRWEILRYDGTPVDVNLFTDFSYRAGQHIVRLSLAARYTTVRELMSRRLLDYGITADFELIGSDVETSSEEIVVNSDLVRLMIGVGLGALRGMVALRTSHTFLAHYPLPVYNVDTLMEPIINASRTVNFY